MALAQADDTTRHIAAPNTTSRFGKVLRETLLCAVASNNRREAASGYPA